MIAPSSKMMMNLNAMIQPYGVPYYSKNDCFPEFRTIFEADSCEVTSAMPSIQDYFLHYELYYKGIPLTDEQKHSMANYFWDDYRTFFGREYDRIICTNSFRRLQYKTQVMVNSASDEQRTRLLHSLEVQRIAKKIAIGIGANSELAENIAIAHDIGHAPFGHSGEEAISDYILNTLKKMPLTYPIKDGATCFLHAMQSTKVLDSIATHPTLQENGINGLGLSDYVLEGVLKHDSDVFSEEITSYPLKNQYDAERLCGIVGVENYLNKIQSYLKDLTDDTLPQVFIGSIESQIVAWADKIAYLGHDWEELLDTKLLEKLMSRINDMVREMYKICEKKSLSHIYNEEFGYVESIISKLNFIENAYSNNTTYSDVWKNEIRGLILDIIVIITEIEKLTVGTHYFTLKEYLALKDYLAMVLSWSQLVNQIPTPRAMKYDPIYIFYMFLTEVRTTIITREVTNKLIKGTLSVIESCSKKLHNESRDDYLAYCNAKWVSMYQTINNHKYSEKQRKKALKDSVRDCYLVKFARKAKFGTEPYEEYDVIKPIEPEQYGFYSYDDTYCCLLNIIKCIFGQYIGSTRVNFMTQQAKKIVTGLMEYYVEHPEMLPYSQRRRYKKNLSERNEELIYFIADYVGGMTDRMAKKKYDEITSSDTKWSNEYSSGLN